MVAQGKDGLAVGSFDLSHQAIRRMAGVVVLRDRALLGFAGMSRGVEGDEHHRVDGVIQVVNRHRKHPSPSRRVVLV